MTLAFDPAHLTLLAASPSATQIVALLGIGILAGLFGGLLGVGGGLVMIPAMTLLFGDALFGVNSFHIFKLAAITTSIVLSIPAVARHAQAKAIVHPMLAGMIVFGLVGVLGGTALASVLADDHTIILKRAFGAFMLVSIAAGLMKRNSDSNGSAGERGTDRCPIPTRWAKIGIIVGFPSGIVAGLLGVGGGIWAVPVQHHLLGIRLRNAIANSACMIIGLAAGSSALHCVYINGLHDSQATVLQGLWLTIGLAPGAVVGGWFGAKLTHTLPVAWIRNVFSVLLAVTGLRLLFS